MLVRSESEGAKEGKIAIPIVTKKDAKTVTSSVRKYAEGNWYWTNRSFLLGNNFITLAFADCLSLLVARKKRKGTLCVLVQWLTTCSHHLIF